MCALGGPDEEDGVRGAVADVHLLALQWLPLFGPGHLRPGLALWGGTAHPQAWLSLRASHHPASRWSALRHIHPPEQRRGRPYLERNEEVHGLPDPPLDGLA